MALSDYIQQPDEPNVQPVDYNDAISKKGLYGFFKDFYKKPDLADEERITRRQRSLSVLGDLAKLTVQTTASAHGARQFQPIQSQVPAYNARLAQIRDAKRAIDQSYQDKSLSAIMQDYSNARQEGLTMANLRAKQAEQNAKFAHDKELATMKGELQLQANKDKIDYQSEKDAAKAKMQHGYKIEQINAQGKQARQTKASSDASANIRESLSDNIGNVWTRKTLLSRNEARNLILQSGQDLNRKTWSFDADPDYNADLAELIYEGKIPREVLEAAGFKQSREVEKKTIEGFGDTPKKKTIEGF